MLLKVYNISLNWCMQAKERKKRAEMNRKQGVNRLKLHFIEKPKPVVFCRHYIAGRCHEVVHFLILPIHSLPIIK